MLNFFMIVLVPSTEYPCVDVPNWQNDIGLISSLLEYSPAVQGVGGSCPNLEIYLFCVFTFMLKII